MKQIRNSNIELLRIFAMFLIVLSHYTIYTPAFRSESFTNQANVFLLRSLDLGNLGVAIFVMITGFFMINKKNIKIKKIFSYFVQAFSISIICFSIFAIAYHAMPEINITLKSIFPILFNQYWFLTAYIVFYLFVPFINKLLNGLSKCMHFSLNTLLIIIFSVLDYFSLKNGIKSPLLDFFLFYSIGSYLRIHGSTFLNNNKHAIIILFVSLLLMPLSIELFDLMSLVFDKFKGINNYFYSRTSPLVLLSASSMLVLTKNFTPRYNRFINKFSSLTLGIYLIHENIFLRDFLWKNIFNNLNYMNSPILILHLLLSVNIVFFSCAILEFIRFYLIDFWIVKYLHKHIDNAQEKMTEMYISKFK